jgi:hypothetical protein
LLRNLSGNALRPGSPVSEPEIEAGCSTESLEIASVACHEWNLSRNGGGCDQDIAKLLALRSACCRPNDSRSVGGIAVEG